MTLYWLARLGDWMLTKEQEPYPAILFLSEEAALAAGNVEWVGAEEYVEAIPAELIDG